MSFCKDNTDVLSTWRHDASLSGNPLIETDEQIDFLMRLARIAGAEIGRMVFHETKCKRPKVKRSRLQIMTRKKIGIHLPQ